MDFKFDYPKANNRNILRPYGKDMKNFKKVNTIMERDSLSITSVRLASLKNNDGSIMHNVLEFEPIIEGRTLHRLPKNVLA